MRTIFCRVQKSTWIYVLLLCVSGQFAALFADGLPGEYLVTQRWRYLFAGKSPISNPAFANEENYISGRYAATSTLQEYYHHEAGATIPLGLYQAFAASWLTQGTKEFNQTKWENGDIAETGLMVRDQHNFFMLTYANNILARLTVGANVNIIHQDLYGETHFGVGADIGLSYRILRNPILGDHLLGLSTQNILMVSDEPFAKTARVSLSSNYWERRIESGFDFTLKDLMAAAGEFSGTNEAGDLVSLPTKIEWDFTGRFGIWVLRLMNIYGLVGFEQQGMEYWGFAGGVNAPSMNMGRDLSFIYQYLTMLEGDASSHTLYIRGDFGKHREEIYARRMARMANISPNLLYQKAMALYSEGNYWDAFFIYSRIMVEYPDFFKNDWVSYYMGSCQEFLDMRNMALDNFSKTKQEYSRSVAIPHADLGMMRIHYRQGDYSNVAVQFNELNKLGVPDSLKYHAFYIMGQTHMKEGNQLKAKQLFALVPEGHPDYVFSQHSAAVANMILGSVETAVSHLENCVQTLAQNESQKEAVNRSYVLLGYLFYEEMAGTESSLAKAVTALRMVPKNSFYYVDALLGLGWTALKARQWTDCVAAGQELQKSTADKGLRAEGALIQAYAHMIQKRFDLAVTLLEPAAGEIANLSPPSAEELAAQRQNYENTRSRYSELASKTNDLAFTRQSSMVLKQIDSLHVHQKDFRDRINKFLLYSDDFERRSFFARNIQAIREDVEYALAKAQKMAGTRESSKIQQKTQEKQKAIDDELQKLREQMEEMKKPE